MSAELVNLRQARKRRDRAAAALAADANRIAHGLTRADKDVAHRTRSMADRRLDQHRRAPAEAEGDPSLP